MTIKEQNFREFLKKINVQNSQHQDVLIEVLKSLNDGEEVSATLDQIIPQYLVGIIREMYADITPDKMAAILHKLYPLKTSTEIGQILLENYPKLTRYEMQKALNGAGFLSVDTQKTLNELYPITVKSTLPWQATGVIVGSADSLQIVALGKWGINNGPSGQCDADGIASLVAKMYYTLPNKPEGALIGRIGDNPPYLAGNSSYAPKGQTGELHLCINDDLDGKYGLGLKDNVGELKIIATIDLC